MNKDSFVNVSFYILIMLQSLFHFKRALLCTITFITLPVFVQTGDKTLYLISNSHLNTQWISSAESMFHSMPYANRY